jgi:hypothetical protein
MGFTKLDDGLIFSSILSEDDAVFKVWVLILSRTDGDGIARISSVFLSSVCHKSDAEVERCLQILEGPDPKSRSTNDEGQRIRRVDGGYEVINYLKYRQRAEQEDVRYYERERKRRQRHPVPGLSGTEVGRSASASSVISKEKEYVPPDVQAERSIRAERVALERRLLTLVQELAQRTNEDPPAIMRQVTAFKTREGRLVNGKVNPALLSDERLEKSLADAEAWLADLKEQK